MSDVPPQPTFADVLKACPAVQPASGSSSGSGTAAERQEVRGSSVWSQEPVAEVMHNRNGAQPPLPGAIQSPAIDVDEILFGGHVHVPDDVRDVEFLGPSLLPFNEQANELAPIEREQTNGAPDPEHAAAAERDPLLAPIYALPQAAPSAQAPRAALNDQMPPLLDSNQNIIPVLDLLDIIHTISNEANATLAHGQRQRRMPIRNQPLARVQPQARAQAQPPMQPPRARLQPQGTVQQTCRHCLQDTRTPQQSSRLFPGWCCAVRRAVATPSMDQVAKPNSPSNGSLGTSGALVPFGPNVRPTIGGENGGSVPQPRRQVQLPVLPIRAAFAQSRRSFGGRLPTAPEGQGQRQRQQPPTTGRESLSERARSLMGETVLPGAPAPHGYNTPLPMLDQNLDFRRCEYFLAEEDTHVGDDPSQLSVTNGGTGDGYFVRSNKENRG